MCGGDVALCQITLDTLFMNHCRLGLSGSLNEHPDGDG